MAAQPRRSPNAPSRRERRSQAIRDALVDAALRVMSKRGVHLTRIEDITEAADVAKGSFYGHFENKDEILAAVIGQIVDEMEPHIAAAQAGPSIAARTRQLFSWMMKFYTQHPGKLLLLHQTRGLLLQELDGYPAARDVLDRFHHLVCAALTAKSGEPLKRDAHAALLLISLAHGYATMLRISPLADGRPVSPEALAEAAAAAVTGFLESA